MIALDANIFVYALEGNKQFGEYAKKLFMAAEQASSSMCASDLIFMEVLAHPVLDEKAATRARRKVEDLGVPLIPVTKQVLLEAARLRRVSKLGALDSIHVASALVTGCKQFVTNDKEVLRRTVKEIEIVPLAQVDKILA